MPLSALFLALAAAFVHATWNLLLARARDPQAATAVALVVSVVAFAPVAGAVWDVDRGVWPYAAGSGALELVYFALLAAAYRRAELSVVYPVARRLAPVLVLVVGIAVLGAGSSAGQAAGVCLIGAGVLLVRGFGRHPDSRGVFFGVAIAACIAAYTLVDDPGIEYANAISYLELTMLFPAVVYGAGVAAWKGLPWSQDSRPSSPMPSSSPRSTSLPRRRSPPSARRASSSPRPARRSSCASASARGALRARSSSQAASHSSPSDELVFHRHKDWRRT